MVKSTKRTSGSRAKVTRLCARCAGIAFHEIFSPTRAFLPLDTFYVTAIGPPRVDPFCSVCYLFNSVAHQNAETSGRGFHLRILSSTTYLGRGPSAQQAQSNVALAVLPESVNFPWLTERHIEQGVVLAKFPEEVLNNMRPTIEGAPVNALHIDFGQLGIWLHHCDTLHVDLCGSSNISRSFAVPLRCIDCDSRDIVHIQDNDEYYALSYVWGTSASTSEHIAGQFSTCLPPQGRESGCGRCNGGRKSSRQAVSVGRSMVH
jgi:hypothetical protein